VPSSRPIVRRTWFPALVAAALVASLRAPPIAQPSSDEVRRDIGAAEERLHELENELGGVVDAYNEVAEELAAIEAELEATQAELDGLTERSEELLFAVEEHVRRLHKLGPGIEMANFIVSGSPTDTSDRMAAIRRIIDHQWADLEAYEASKTSIAAVEDRLALQQQWASDRAAQLEERRDQVETFIDEQQDEIDELEATLEAALSREEAERRRAEEQRRREAAERARQEQLAQQDAAGDEDGDGDGATTASAAPAVSDRAQVAVDAALSKLGSPYRWGATGPDAFDCSGLMVWAWGQAGVSLPRTSAGQFNNLPRISRSELQPGDLVFAGSPTVHHVGMYIGNGQIVHSPHSGTTVSIRSMERSDLRGFARPG
jgi:peptidoglycan DL-endopeptidase CwlO